MLSWFPCLARVQRNRVRAKLSRSLFIVLGIMIYTHTVRGNDSRLKIWHDSEEDPLSEPQLQLTDLTLIREIKIPTFLRI